MYCLFSIINHIIVLEFHLDALYKIKNKILKLTKGIY